MRVLSLFLLVNILTSADANIKQRRSTTTPSDVTTTAWLREAFPNPEHETDSCRSSHSKQMCDPDSILTDEDVAAVEKSLRLPRTFPHPCPPLLSAEAEEDTEEEESQSVDIQFAVALVAKMDMTPFGRNVDQEERAARLFARQLHDEWGVGIATLCGGTGILVFLSDRDRAIHISRGTALQQVLTDRRLDRTIANMKPLLQKKQYGDAIVSAFREMDYLIHLGEPEWKERLSDWIATYTGWVCFAGVVGLVLSSIWKQSREQRAYARVASQLNELDQARAEALQGRFLASSCPICLENFQPRAQDASPQKGSDDLPLKLLRCGHVFDETCWAEWVNSGQGNITKCPICKQDVGGSTDVPSTTTRNEGTATRRVVGTSTDNVATSTSSTTTTTTDSVSLQQTGSRVLQQYTRERNFRLTRLSLRYPQFIRPQQLQRWTQSTHNGPLARDPSFVKSDPQRSTGEGGGGSSSNGGRGRSSGSSSSGGFGGGSSGGGRGGRW